MNVQEYQEFKDKMRYWEAMVDVADKTISLSKKLNEFRPWPRSKKRESFYPSDATRCERALYWALCGEPESNAEFSDEQINIFGLGDVIEKTVVEKYKRLPGPVWEGVGGGFYIPGFEDADEWQNEKGVRPQITYYMDAIWRDVDGMVLGEPSDLIVEIKSIAQFPFHSQKNKYKDYTWYGADMIPKSDNYTQLQMYLWGEDKEFGLLHYHSKNDGEEKVWLIERDDEFIEEIFARLTKIFWQVHRGELPDRPYVAYPSAKRDRLVKGTKVNGKYCKSDWHCLYCAYADKCWEVGNYQPEEE